MVSKEFWALPVDNKNPGRDAGRGKDFVLLKDKIPNNVPTRISRFKLCPL